MEDDVDSFQASADEITTPFLTNIQSIAVPPRFLFFFRQLFVFKRATASMRDSAPSGCMITMDNGLFFTTQAKRFINTRNF